jgi:hypothetical protein
MKLVYLMLLFILLSSCEGYVNVRGQIKSAKDNNSVAGAKIELLDIPATDSVVLSDSNGSFVVRSKMIGMVKTPKYRIRVTKEKFKPAEIKFNYGQSSQDSENRRDSLIIMLDEN